MSTGTMHTTLPLLNYGCEFTDATSLLAEYVLGFCGHNDDFRAGRCDTNLNARITIFGKFTSQELVQLSLEDSVGDKLFGWWWCAGRKKLRLCFSTFLLDTNQNKINSK